MRVIFTNYGFEVTSENVTQRQKIALSKWLTINQLDNEQAIDNGAGHVTHARRT